MNKSTIVKEQIMEILSDKQEHKASEIKEMIRNKYQDLDITEGVFSNSFRTLTLAGKCMNKERGVYVINCGKNKEKNKTEEYYNDYNCHEGKKSKEYIKIQMGVSDMLAKMREEFRNLVKDINILDADDEVVSYILKVRHVLEELEKGIKN
ncbi:hypothetical protein ACTNBM_09225 [Lachnospiraceae bacterium HCP1S3_C3]